jgi:hypothetical protein
MYTIKILTELQIISKVTWCVQSVEYGLCNYFLFTMCFTPFQVSVKGRCQNAKKSFVSTWLATWLAKGTL